MEALVTTHTDQKTIGLGGWQEARLKQSCFQISTRVKDALVEEGQEGGGGQGRGQPVLQPGEDLGAPGGQVISVMHQ